MKGIFYEFLLLMSRLVGIWFVAAFSWFVSSGYFFFRPRVVANNYSFYRAVFPEKNALGVLGIVWRQFHHFATVFVDRIGLEGKGRFFQETIGRDAFDKNRAQGRGAVFLMSHFGNWEIAARLLSRKGTPIMLHLGRKEREQIEQRQKHDLSRDGVRVLTVSQEGGTPFDLLETVRVLRNGGVVSIAGDRVQGDTQRQMEAGFFGQRILVPVAPHILAMMAEVPIFVLFTVRLKSMHYQVILKEPYLVPKARGRDREEPLRESIDRYLGYLEEMVRAHPEHWYRFEPD